MRVMGLLGIVVFSAPSADAARAPGGATVVADTAIERIKLAEGIYLFRSPSAREIWTATNSVVIINDEDVTVFDSNTRPSTTRLIVAEIRKLTSKPVRQLINSHWHMDHWSGNEVYAREFPGLTIYATTQTRDFMKRLVPRFFVQSINVSRERARVDSMIRTGKQRDGTPFTPADRRREEADLAEIERFATEMAGVTHVLPNVAFPDSLTFWSGRREFRLISITGDASGSAILYLPNEKLLVTGDALVRTEDGRGAQPWTTNSYAITPWLAGLRTMEALDASVIVPGQGPELHDKEYLRQTIALFEAILRQVHAALEGGAVTVSEVRERVNLDAIRDRFTGGDAELGRAFKQMTDRLIEKTYQEAHDGAIRG